MDPIAPSTRSSSFRSFVRRHHKTPVRTGGISKPRMYRHAVVSYEAALGSQETLLIAERDRVCGG